MSFNLVPLVRCAAPRWRGVLCGAVGEGVVVVGIVGVESEGWDGDVVWCGEVVVEVEYER